MEALLTWRYFVVPEDKFGEIKPLADELDALRDRELSEEESKRQEDLMDQINSLGEKIAKKVIVYKDEGDLKDGTIAEELVYRMGESEMMGAFRDEYYYHFLVYITPEQLASDYEAIEKIFKTIADHDLLKTEFLGEWIYLDRAQEIFGEVRAMFKEAYESKCGIIKTDKLEWQESGDEDREEEPPPLWMMKEDGIDEDESNLEDADDE